MSKLVPVDVEVMALKVEISRKIQPRTDENFHQHLITTHARVHSGHSTVKHSARVSRFPEPSQTSKHCRGMQDLRFALAF